MHQHFKEALTLECRQRFLKKKKKKSTGAVILRWGLGAGRGYREPALGFDGTAQCTEHQSRETNSAPEMKNLLSVLTTSVLF